MGVGCDPVNSACDSEKIVATGVVAGEYARQSGRVSRVTKTQRLAAEVLKQDISEYVSEKRQEGYSWASIVACLYEDTRGLIDLNRETLRVWARNGFQAEDK
jgi:hypothetical protein